MSESFRKIHIVLFILVVVVKIKEEKLENPTKKGRQYILEFLFFFVCIDILKKLKKVVATSLRSIAIIETGLNKKNISIPKSIH